jgi:hypothetical protein
MGWNILPRLESEYFDFILKTFEPELSNLGLRTIEVWYTVYGDWPQIVTGVLAENQDKIERVLASKEWQNLKEQLLEYVSDYQHKIIPANGGYQL